MRGQRAKCLLPHSTCTFLPQAGAAASDTPSQAPETPLEAETRKRYAPAAVGQRTVQKSCSISRKVHNSSAKAAGAESKEAGSRRQRAQTKGRRARRKAKHLRSDIACHTQSELSFRLPLATQHTCAARVSAVWMLLDASGMESLEGKTYDSTRLTRHGRSSLSLGVNERGLEVRYCHRAAADKRAAG